MKKFILFSTRFLAGVFLVAGLIAGGSYVLAEEKPVPSNEEVLQSLSEAVEKLSQAIQPQSQPNQIVAPAAAANTTYEYPACFQDIYQNKSFTRDTSKDWAMWQFPGHNQNSPAGALFKSQFLDINGDGLSDYVYNLNSKRVIQAADSYTGNVIYYSGEKTCIFLNNGHGWNIAYRCVAAQSADPTTGKARPVYYGDCAL